MSQRGNPWPKVHDGTQGLPAHTEADQGWPASTEISQNLRALLDEAGLSETEDPFEALRALVRDYQRLANGRAALEEYGPPSPEQRRLIEAGRLYRQQLIDRTLSEGVRAIEGFNREAQEKRLGRLSLEEIQQELDTYEPIAKEKFPGGRQAYSDREHERNQELQSRRNGQPADAPRRVPDDAYRG
jgi:hypothetical protein